MTENNKDKDSYQEEVDALKAELKRLKAKEGINNSKEKKIFCSNCNAEVQPGSKFCTKCGTVIEQNKSSNEMSSKDRLARSSTVNVSLGRQPSQYSDPSWDDIKSKRLSSGLLGIFFGAFGAHKFVLGYTQEGLIYLGVSILGGIITCGGAFGVTSILALIESIMYLTKSPEEFKRTYIDNKKGWF